MFNRKLNILEISLKPRETFEKALQRGNDLGAAKGGLLKVSIFQFELYGAKLRLAVY